MKYDTNELRRVLRAQLLLVCPVVYYGWTTAPTAYPYLVYDLAEVSYDSGKVTYELEINCVGKDASAIITMADQVQALFAEYHYSNTKIFFHCHRGRRNSVEEEDRSLSRVRLTFTLSLFSKEEV